MRRVSAGVTVVVSALAVLLLSVSASSQGRRSGGLHRPMAAGAAQSPRAVPPLGAAERALVSALMLPDGEAFRQLLADDAVFFVPAEAHGPDAIVAKWRPFLSGPQVRLAPIIESSTIGDSGATGQTSGSFAVYGRTSNGMSTTPAGGFSILWRLDGGEWKIVMLTRG
jgi:ketosteroid isomerase-like protein